MTASQFPSKFVTTNDKRVKELFRLREKIIKQKKEQQKLKINPHKPAYKVLEDGAWKGERCFIIAGGPSCSGFDFDRLKGKGRIIAVNKAFYDCMFADICYFMDSSQTTFYGLVTNGKLGQDYKKSWDEFEGLKIHMNLTGRIIDEVYSIRSLGEDGISMHLKKGMYHGNNSGTGALYLAILLKANPIYLLGVDGKFSKGKTHYHTGYPGKYPESVYKSFVPRFEFIGRKVYKTGVKIYNCNFNSAVRCFPFKSIEKALT